MDLHRTLLVIHMLYIFLYINVNIYIYTRSSLRYKHVGSAFQKVARSTEARVP